jgi:hypothetical protein
MQEPWLAMITSSGADSSDDHAGMRPEDRRHHEIRQPDREAAGQLHLLHVAISQAYAPPIRGATHLFVGRRTARA